MMGLAVVMLSAVWTFGAWHAFFAHREARRARFDTVRLIRLAREREARDHDLLITLYQLRDVLAARDGGLQSWREEWKKQRDRTLYDFAFGPAEPALKFESGPTVEEADLAHANAQDYAIAMENLRRAQSDPTHRPQTVEEIQGDDTRAKRGEDAS